MLKKATTYYTGVLNQYWSSDLTLKSTNSFFNSKECFLIAFNAKMDLYDCIINQLDKTIH